jgi:solute carrier family 25 folate transporter 32
MSASLATYPHEVIRTRLQNQTRKPYKYKGILHAIKIMSKEEGLSGFYKGLTTNLLRTVPSSAMTILTYELIVRKFDDWKNL